MQPTTTLTSPSPVSIGSPSEVLNLAPNASYPAPFMAAAEHLAGLWKCSQEEALSSLDDGLLYALPLADAARAAFFAALGPDDREWAAIYIDFERYGRDCLAAGRLVAFDWEGQEFTACPFRLPPQ